ncbi:MAG: helix-turn-helix domain-containing protein [Acutalibacteraceae bacterium]
MNEKESVTNTEKTDFLETQAREMCKNLVQDFKKARQKKGLSLRGLESISGIYHPHIARMESGRAIPNLKTIIKLLAPMGKTLYIGNIKASAACEDEREPTEQLSIF